MKDEIKKILLHYLCKLWHDQWSNKNYRKPYNNICKAHTIGGKNRRSFKKKKSTY